MQKENLDFIIAEAGSGYTYIGAYYEMIKSNEQVFNLQLRYWIEAKNRFEGLNGNFVLEEALLIIKLLCGSLEALAGVNINPPKNDYTPPLDKLFEETLKNNKGWDICSEKPELFTKLVSMDKYNKNLCKHLHKGRKDLLKEINYEKLNEYMKTTQEIWLWVLDKKYHGNIPEDQLQFLK